MEMSFELFNQTIEDYMKEGMSEAEAIAAAGKWLDQCKKQDDFSLVNDTINNAIAHTSSFYVLKHNEDVVKEVKRIETVQSEWRKKDND